MLLFKLKKTSLSLLQSGLRLKRPVARRDNLLHQSADHRVVGRNLRNLRHAALPGGDLRGLNKELTAALNGRGGGKPNFQQGSVKAGEREIQAFFEGKGFKKGKI